MYPIIKKEKLADKIYLMDVKAERVAKSAKPGQFVIVKIDEEGERIPLTICDYDEKAGTVTIVFQTVGASTERMVLMASMEWEPTSYRNYGIKVFVTIIVLPSDQ